MTARVSWKACAHLVLEGFLSKLIRARCVKQMQGHCIRIHLETLQCCHRDADIQKALITGLMIASADLLVQIAQVLACTPAGVLGTCVFAVLCKASIEGKEDTA